MQTTHKIPGSSATTWSRYLVSQASRGDYYTHDGPGGQSAPTRWHGPEQLLRSYGIDPEKPVELDDLRSLMHGFSPIDGEAIRPAGSDKTRVAAIDVTYSPPKDVSALWATADPYRRAQIEAAHRKAVKSALERTEREVKVVRRKTNGVVRFEKAKGLLAVEAVHTSSRLGRDQDAHGIPDPQLHSHVAIIAAERQDGKVAAVESKQLFLSARESGAWYRAELAHNLSELGLGIERRQGKGERYFGIHGVSMPLSEHWSSRTQDVDRAAQLFRQRYGREPRAGELDSLTLGTRGSKSAAESVDVNAAWRALGEEHNQTARRSEELFHHRSLHRDPDIDLRKELLAEVTRERSMITTRELRAKAYELSAGVCRPAEADRLVHDLAHSGELVRLEDGTWTTKTLREMELSTLNVAQTRAEENPAPVSERSLKQARREIAREIKGSLSAEQRDALDTITGAGGVAVLVGRAGTGKGVVISTATRVWQLDGSEVIGTAIAGSRAQQLRDEARLDRAYTTDGLINGVENGHIRLGPDTVVVMDEAGMADSDRLSRLVKLTAERDSKLLLVGDSAQLSSIGPGGLFAHLEARVPTAELTEVHRAHHEWERRAWEQIRAGEPGPALAQYQSHDRLHIHDTRAEAAEAMVDDWDHARKSVPRSIMITDASNAERDQINAMAQERRAQPVLARCSPQRAIETFYNPKLDPGQQEVVRAALAADDLLVVQGPPGTGKTTAICEIVRQYLARDPTLKILLASQTHQAVDNVLLRLTAVDPDLPVARVASENTVGKVNPLIRERYWVGNTEPWEPPVVHRAMAYRNLIRAQTRAGDRIDDEVTTDVLRIQEDYLASVGPQHTLQEKLAQAMIIAGTCAAISSKDLRDIEFGVGILEEAGKATPPDSLTLMLRARKSILVGDTRQLLPHVWKPMREALRKPHLLQSPNPNHEQETQRIREMIKRLGSTEDEREAADTHTLFAHFARHLEGTHHEQTLTTQYRMLPPIGELVSQAFYRDIGGLQHAREIPIDPRVAAFAGQVRVRLVDLPGREQHEHKSAMRIPEVDHIRRELKALNDKAAAVGPPAGGPELLGVAVITPYAAQARQLEGRLDLTQYPALAVRVGIVDRFQGDEDQVVFLSMAATTAAGFLKIPNRINVAVSRAQDLLVITTSLPAAMKGRIGTPFQRVATFIDWQVEQKHPGYQISRPNQQQRRARRPIQQPGRVPA